MATIKPIEARSIHQIQSGQVIVDLCSVVKELVENSLDAGATSIEVRFRNNGLDAVEVQDNGRGISPDNYESVALKHYTSKLGSYEDLEDLQTFGFRGEALSSLCALSTFHVVTAQEGEAPKGSRLNFDISGKLKGTSVTASQRGTTAFVEKLFHNLPVRRKELEKNIKREYGKVLGLLHAYACISTGVKFRVINQMSKTKTLQVFHTNANQTTKENIANVYGAKTLTALIPLDLELEFEPNRTQRLNTTEDRQPRKIIVRGHISRPVFGEGRQTPDRQMFFVNTRPCGLPQIARAFNEVYKSFNVSQSPFIFADFKMDTNAYDVNVSPDKRTIALHDAGSLIESLKTNLMEMFENQDQTVPQSQLGAKLPVFKQLTIPGAPSADTRASSVSKGSESPREEEEEEEDEDEDEDEGDEHDQNGQENSPDDNEAEMRDARAANLIQGLLNRKRSVEGTKSRKSEGPSKEKQKLAKRIAEYNKKMERKLVERNEVANSVDDYDDAEDILEADSIAQRRPRSSIPVKDFNARVVSLQDIARSRSASKSEIDEIEDDEPTERIQILEPPIAAVEAQPQSSQPGIVQNAFDRMRPKRPAAEVATITVGGKTTTSVIGGPSGKRAKLDWEQASVPIPSQRDARKAVQAQTFGLKLQNFAAPGTQVEIPSTNEGQETESESEPESAMEGAERDADIDEPADKAEVSQITPPPNEISPGDSDDESGSDPEEEGATAEEEGSDNEYIDEAEKRREEEAKVQELIREAEEKAALPTENNTKRANKILKGGQRRDLTTTLAGIADGSIAKFERQMDSLRETMQQLTPHSADELTDSGIVLDQSAAEERLSLTVAKSDFADMRIIGQFNLGFILATRSSDSRKGVPSTAGATSLKDDLFIIDQHASDEKFNFETLQANTVVQNQRLVKPLTLNLTAVEEEIIESNLLALERNGFIVKIDDSDAARVGRRCKLLTLPLSREVIFDPGDLEELITLLAESPSFGTDAADGHMYLPRPTKVRKMFAMRACRSSVMVGKTLSSRQMRLVVGNMGKIDKPWNCPHGRPTMRHLLALDGWRGWSEGDGLGSEEGVTDEDVGSVWRDFVRGNSD